MVTTYVKNVSSMNVNVVAILYSQSYMISLLFTFIQCRFRLLFNLFLERYIHLKLIHTVMENKDRGRLSKKCCLSLVKNDLITIKVVGIINTIAFQRTRVCAEKLSQHLPYAFSQPQIIEMFQMDWHEYICKMKREVGGNIWSVTQTVAVFINDEFLGQDVEFFRYINQNYIFSLPFGARYYENLAIERCKQFMEKSKRKYVYITFSTDYTTTGSFVFMLYSDLLPTTCQHFLNLLTGYDEIKQIYTRPYYINTYVHRIVKNGWIQCGDTDASEITENIAADVALVPDESYCIPHDRCGVLSMAHNGKHTNKSQFFICLKPNPWMNQYYVAFGQLIDGAKTLKVLENIPTYYEHPTKRIIISQCGEYLFDDEIRMETGSKVFLQHQPPVSMEGENMATDDIAFDFYSITPWLDNIVDRIDVRDTESILMAEKYLNGLYCLVSDYEPDMDMRIYEKRQLYDAAKYDTTTAKLHDLLLNFHPDVMTDKEKMSFVSKISKIILAYMFYHEYNEFCLKHISLHTYSTINKVLEIAYKISLKAAEKIEGPISHQCSIKIPKIFEAKHANKTLVSEGCMILLEDILNKAILCLIKTMEIEEQ